MQTQIDSLQNTITDLLSTIKDMSTYDDILFRLIDIMKDISNIKTTCSNLDNLQQTLQTYSHGVVLQQNNLHNLIAE